MKSLKVLAVIILALVMCSCASTGTTPEQRTALCLDTQAALATADAALANLTIGTQERQYWMAFRAGAAFESLPSLDIGGNSVILRGWGPRW